MSASGKVPVITRFAPSPTGALHVGGARTALFSWAYARKHAGKFILRFEDTDQARSSLASEKSILEDLTWLGIDWDEGPFRQSERLDLYNEQIAKLLKTGQAYETDGAVRFRVGRDIAIEDAVFGRVEVKTADIEDFVIRKSDGFPTFHFAVVVDDALMNVTHVIRGQEHLSNTPKHAALYDALGYARPTWAHTPSIMNPDGSKMSKRDKAKVARKAAIDAKLDDPSWAAFLNKDSDDIDIAKAIARRLSLKLPEIDVSDFRNSGYLPAVLCNYLVLLGWNPGNNVEVFDINYFIDHFSLERIGKANSKFDRDKLFRFNADAIKALAPEVFRAKLYAFSEKLRSRFGGPDDPAFVTFAWAYQERSRTLGEPEAIGGFFFADEITYDSKAVEKVLVKGEGYAVLRDLLPALRAVEPWNAQTVDVAVKLFAESRKLGMGQIAQPLRVAVTGSTVSPSIHDTLAILGKDKTLARIVQTLKLQDQNSGLVA